MDTPTRIGAKIATLIGAKPTEVVVADSTSVNLFKLAVAALRTVPDRSAIITDDLNFPSDLYVLQGITRLFGERKLKLQVLSSADGVHGPVDDVAQACNSDTALVTLSHTAYQSGYVYDMASTTAAAHDAGARVLWDLSHSAGAVPVDLNGAHADFAVGCTYKYLNGGPGAPAFLYVREDLHESVANPVRGWMGRDNMFDFGLEYSPRPGVERFLTGTPPIVSTSLIEPGVDILLEAGLNRIREKSVRQTDYLINLWRTMLEPLGFRLNSPTDNGRRGSHVSLGHDDGMAIVLALINEVNVLPDFREPDSIRFGVAPLYTRFVDIFDAVDRTVRVVVGGVFEKYKNSRPLVT